MKRQITDKYSVLKNNFGYSLFRPGQAEIIDSLLAGRDVLAVLPTGAGKSLCYQIPALLAEGLTIVVSPLISLMKDQVGALLQADLPAAFLNSSLSRDEYITVMRRAESGAYKLVYIAPERLLRDDIARLITSVPVSMVIVDEAHCLSHWGHDFRPSYLMISAFINLLPKRPVVAAFTATATNPVKHDIIMSLELRNPFFITTGFDRPNLYFSVQKNDDKIFAVLNYLNKRKNKHGVLNTAGIIYCSTRKVVEELCRVLTNNGFLATRYHAGLDDAERHTNQDDFLFDHKNIMVATNAFGMGINKPNVNFVIHYNMPKNLESYYQEAGRAGRDGSAADCILLYSPKDIRTNEFLIKQGGSAEFERDEEQIERNLELLKYMTFYATATDCLRARLLSYFGDTASVPQNYCGHCSNCQTHFECVDITIEAQKVVSCVLRLKQRGRRLGKTLVTQILRGSKSEKILKDTLETLSTYGIMKDTSEKRCREIIDFLLLHEYLTLTPGDYPALETTTRSKEIVFEKKKVEMMLAKEVESLVIPARKQEERHLSLFEKLKKCRLELARKANFPAYVIFNDLSLQAMSELMPQDHAAFLNIPGVGAVKAEKYGDAFMQCIQKHLKQEAEFEDAEDW